MNREFEGIENQTDSSPLVLVREKGLLSDGGKLGWRINERISRYDGSNVFSLILEEKSRDETLLKKGLLLLKTHGDTYIYIYMLYTCVTSIHRLSIFYRQTDAAILNGRPLGLATYILG